MLLGARHGLECFLHFLSCPPVNTRLHPTFVHTLVSQRSVAVLSLCKLSNQFITIYLISLSRGSVENDE